MRTNKTKDNIADAILRKLINKRNTKTTRVDLTPEQEEYLRKLTFIDNLFLQHNPVLTKYQIFKIYKEKYNHSKQQFYSDLHNCQMIFGTLHAPSKDYMRQVYTAHLEKCIALGFATGDLKAVRESIKISSEINQLNLPDKEEGEVRPTRLEMRVIIQVNGNLSEQIMNIDEFQKLPEDEFKKIIGVIDRPRVGVEEMTKLMQNDERNDAE